MQEVPRQGHDWDHSSDAALLQFLRAFTAQLDGQMSACRTSLDRLAQSVTDVATDISRAETAFSLLSSGTFVEKQVEEPDDFFTPQPLPQAVGEPDDAAQAARKPQAATLQQALAAVVGSGAAPSHARPLPHIYGSAEYLQDAQAGLGTDTPVSEAAVAAGQGAEPFMSEPESSSLTSEGEASELESLRNFSQAGAPGRLPDFRSMLEAALRGDVPPAGVAWGVGAEGGPPGTARSTRSLGGFSELWSASEVGAHPPARSLRRPSGGSSAAASASPAAQPLPLRRTSSSTAASGPSDTAVAGGSGGGSVDDNAAQHGQSPVTDVSDVAVGSGGGADGQVAEGAAQPGGGSE